MRIFFAGGAGFLGNALVPRLRAAGHEVSAPRSGERDLTDIEACVEATKGADMVIHAAGFVPSRKDQEKFPASIFYKNTLITLQLLEAARRNNIQKMILVGSIAGYPPSAAPKKEEVLFSNAVPDLSRPSGFYGLSKWMMVPAGRAYAEESGVKVRVVPFPNLYGPHDKFDRENSPLVPGTIKMVERAMQEGKKEYDGGPNAAVRIDLLHVDDACDFLMLLIGKFGDERFRVINAGSGRDYSIREIVEAVAKATGFNGKILWSGEGKTSPVFLDTAAAAEIGWKPKVALEDGINRTVRWFREQHEQKDQR